MVGSRCCWGASKNLSYLDTLLKVKTMPQKGNVPAGSGPKIYNCSSPLEADSKLQELIDTDTASALILVGGEVYAIYPRQSNPCKPPQNVVMRLQALALIPPVVWERMQIEGFEVVAEGKTLKVINDRSDVFSVLELADEIRLLEALHWLDDLEYFEKLEYWNAEELQGRFWCRFMPFGRWLHEQSAKERGSGR